MASKISSSPAASAPDASEHLRSLAQRVPAKETCCSAGSIESRSREALALWLQWNQAYEQAASHMFAAGASPEKIEDFMDSMDQLRREAIALTRSLLA